MAIQINSGGEESTDAKASGGRMVVTADGTYATQSAFTSNAATKSDAEARCSVYSSFRFKISHIYPLLIGLHGFLSLNTFNLQSTILYLNRI